MFARCVAHHKPSRQCSRHKCANRLLCFSSNAVPLVFFCLLVLRAGIQPVQASPPSKPQTVVLSAEVFAAWKADEEARAAEQQVQRAQQQQESKKKKKKNSRLQRNVCEVEEVTRSIMRPSDEEEMKEDCLFEEAAAPPLPQGMSARRARSSENDVDNCCDDDDDDEDDLEGSAQPQGIVL